MERAFHVAARSPCGGVAGGTGCEGGGIGPVDGNGMDPSAIDRSTIESQHPCQKEIVVGRHIPAPNKALRDGRLIRSAVERNDQSRSLE